MKPTEKKWPHPNAAGRQSLRPAMPERPAAHAHQFKPAVAQTKSAAPPSARPHPAAPPVYKPQAKPNAVQQKSSGPPQMRVPPAAPPPLRTQPPQGALQTRVTSVRQPQSGQTPRRPVPPPAYRPEPKKIIQPKLAAEPVRRQTTVPPSNRPVPMPRVLQPIGSETKFTARGHFPPAGQGRRSPQALNLRPTLVIQRAAAAAAAVERKDEKKAPKPKKGVRVAHTTKAGKMKASTFDFLKNLPKGTKDAEVVAIWEKHHSMLDGFAAADTDGLPPNTTGTLPQRIDLAALQGEYYLLGKMLSDAVGAALNNSRGAHGNDEEKLPVYVGVTPYEEFGFFKGGGRLVVDHTSGRQYISLHYSTFYRVA